VKVTSNSDSCCTRRSSAKMFQQHANTGTDPHNTGYNCSDWLPYLKAAVKQSFVENIPAYLAAAAGHLLEGLQVQGVGHKVRQPVHPTASKQHELLLAGQWVHPQAAESLLPRPRARAGPQHDMPGPRWLV
jgi:hypothetical protein